MDYEKLKEALVLIKEICKDCSNCDVCPLGDNNENCLIQDNRPTHWDIADKQVVRLLK